MHEASSNTTHLVTPRGAPEVLTKLPPGCLSEFDTSQGVAARVGHVHASFERLIRTSAAVSSVETRPGLTRTGHGKADASYGRLLDHALPSPVGVSHCHDVPQGL